MIISPEIPLPLTASLNPEKNIGVEKVLYTGRIANYPLGKNIEIDRVFNPWTVGLSPTSRCTRKCFFCSHQERNKQRQFLSKARMDEIIADLKDSITPKGVILAGGGEPTFWEEDLSPYISKLSNFCSVGIDTNGTLLDRYLKSGAIWRLFYITVPILGHDRDSYQKICNRDQFRTVDKNLRDILAIKEKQKLTYPHINVKVAVNSRTYRDFIPMLRYAESIAPDNIFVRLMNNFENRTDIELTNKQRQFVYEAVADSSEFEPGYANVFAENLIQSPSSDQSPRFSPATHCWSVLLMHNMGIKQSGDVFLCVPTTDHDEYSIGNVNHTRITELWGGPRHLEVIEKLDRRMRDGLCDFRKCRHSKLNIVLEMARRGEIEINLPENQFLERHGPFL